MNITFHLTTLGCPKNRVDSEKLWASLALYGLRAVDDPRLADVIVLNTCAFIRRAVDESLETILELAENKRHGRCRLLAVGGCLPARYDNQLDSELPEVDLFFRAEKQRDLFREIRKRFGNFISPPACRKGICQVRVNSLSAGAAYLKIAEGCSRRCSFCIIPRLRGPLRSTTLAKLVEEAARLAAMGVKELVLVAQELTAWGKDLAGKPRLTKLLERLGQTDGIRWIRLMYLYPSEVKSELLDFIAGSEKVLPYLDIPLQHVDAGILKKMRRGGSPSSARKLVEKIRKKLPGAVLRTSLMTGFPGENEKAFRSLLDFVREARFERLGVFEFSPEEESPACRLPGRVSKKIARQRRNRILLIQQKVSAGYHRCLEGQVIDALVEKPLGAGRFSGRIWSQAPEVDGHTIIRGTPRPGEMVQVMITASGPYHLEGRMVESSGESSGDSPRRKRRGGT